jgi:hypothetical protein
MENELYSNKEGLISVKLLIIKIQKKRRNKLSA